MTITQQSPVSQLPQQTIPSKGGGPDKGGTIVQVQQKQVKGAGTVPTAGSPQQAPQQESWFSRNIKLIGIVGGAAVGGAIGFLTLGPLGGLGGAAIGALAGFLLTRNSGQSSAGQLPPPPPTGG